MSRRSRSIWWTAALVALMLAAAMPASASASASRACGLTPRIHGVRYDVREVHGSVACRTVRRAVTTFLRSGAVAAPCVCFRGHGSSPYAVSCTRGKRVLVRVYSPT